MLIALPGEEGREHTADRGLGHLCEQAVGGEAPHPSSRLVVSGVFEKDMQKESHPDFP